MCVLEELPFKQKMGFQSVFVTFFGNIIEKDEEEKLVSLISHKVKLTRLDVDDIS